MNRPHAHPVARWRVIAGAGAILGCLAGVGWFAEHLRHPPREQPTTPEPDDPSSDPRRTVVCDQPPVGPDGARLEAGAQDASPEVTSNQLYDCPQTWDGRRVRYRGEVVGAVLRRDQGAWVHLNDDVYGDSLGPLPAHRDYRGGNAGAGVLIPHALADRIAHVGGPAARGDILEIVGVFRRVDPASEEVAVIVADGGQVATVGGPFADPPLTDRRVAATILATLAAGSVAAERVAARRR